MLARLQSLSQSSPGWPIGLGRIMLGLIWLSSLRWKLPPDFEPTEGVEGLRGYLEMQVENPGFDFYGCLLYTSPSPRDATLSRMPSSA